MTGKTVKIEFSSAFSRHLKKLNPQIRKKLPALMVIFSGDPFHRRLKTHKLTGKLKDKYAFSLAPNLRIVFTFIDNNQTALFIDIGAHNQVYR
ncbi:type II toxin-antitoxin system mRNA interferase toxin, RelE/StbE family [Candidatus Beckwithbacteria bacterium CG_4_10_14_0_2_um_filter_47_25]|uniref:Type II toxin-antitoxin system mRNA interferase toxin, RelE/StbE family n=3 Tax=Candidatus Beckwithiibacteriota TaxID=1752726 RepID=A0A2H0B650_9BACT|nr:MAG: type II toxin-antitoxin system mRNA interferase toxin, RelE/StbE family [Candidatus Beckwithbacteria bacterium CG23_combo_of_CG06-09_8_20_14_all_47_9]PJA22700.1 MAG: type II toxin-antitoxin system mRNA interferase toxin, RelE/StbE family [Candidatus Beckwithbacteria bacterium CG_4_10_14_0_2_um_filter_47_25]PJC66223.1 MAG: type II toxin-antitoxin system mRNA interferase toxin, RelE/StbE family [Candidatus Beckwithbacteria bacterium CG_4_9_14_0_2_um_filter_47_11]